MDNPLFYTELQGRRENGEETVSLVLTNEEYEEIVSKYGTERKILKTDDDDFERAQKAALPGETLSRAYRSVPKTNGFIRKIIDGYNVKRDAQGNVMAGVAVHTVTHPVPVRDGFKVNGNKITTEINAGAGSSNMTHQAAIIDGYSETGARVTGTINTGAASTLQIKPSEIRESMTFKAPKVNQATSAGIQADSRYKNTIKE